MTVKASIDIGSNSILLLIANHSNSEVEILENEAHVTGLGRDLDLNGNFLNEAMDESYSVLKLYKELCIKHKVKSENIIATATEASRVSTNAREFYTKIRLELGISVKIISGEAEAYYSTMGILFDEKIDDDLITIMDIGGASTELIRVDTKSKKILKSFSMPMGAVRFNNWRSEKTLEANIANVLSRFAADLESVKTNKLYCVAGTMTSVGAIYLNDDAFIEDRVNGLEFAFEEISKMLVKFKDFEAEHFLSKFPFLGKRSATIQSGLMLADLIMRKVGVNDIYISTYGLRYGTLLEGRIRDEFIIS